MISKPVSYYISLAFPQRDRVPFILFRLSLHPAPGRLARHGHCPSFVCLFPVLSALFYSTNSIHNFTKFSIIYYRLTAGCRGCLAVVQINRAFWFLTKRRGNFLEGSLQLINSFYNHLNIFMHF